MAVKARTQIPVPKSLYSQGIVVSSLKVARVVKNTVNGLNHGGQCQALMGENIAGTSCCRWRPMRAKRGQVFIWVVLWVGEEETASMEGSPGGEVMSKLRSCLALTTFEPSIWSPTEIPGPSPSCKDFTLQSLGQALQWLIPPWDPAHQRLPPLLKSPAWKIKKGHWGGWGGWGVSMLKCLCLYVSLCMRVYGRYSVSLCVRERKKKIKEKDWLWEFLQERETRMWESTHACVFA